MKKIVPFNNILEFNTDVCEITAISLEHKMVREEDMITGEFYISGEYKITDGQLDREKFNFELPFDIALGSNYERETLVIDIDDFRYELVERNKLKVNIDLYIDGQIIPEEVKEVDERVSEIKTDESYKINSNIKNELDIEMLDDKNKIGEDEVTVVEDKLIIENDNRKKESLFMNREDDIVKGEKEKKKEETIVDRGELFDEIVDWDKEIDDEVTIDKNIINNNENNNIDSKVNILDGLDGEEKYATYRVYRVMEGDTIDKIIEKYNATKEELEKYNNIVEIKIGDKLIIPANDK